MYVAVVVIAMSCICCNVNHERGVNLAWGSDTMGVVSSEW